MIKRGMKEEERGDWDDGRGEEGREKGVIEGSEERCGGLRPVKGR